MNERRTALIFSCLFYTTEKSKQKRAEFRGR
uniref:Uncharacterized protein n=1 Tax=Rhizophora mucronata TaxID=61149 RepID=A0A2P2PGP7_RHIMU